MSEESSDTRARWNRARQRWPGVDLSLERFAEGLDARRAAAPNLDHTDDLYLLLSCLEADERALAAFQTSHLAPLLPALRSIDPSPDFGAEVLDRLTSELFTGPSPSAHGYLGTGPLSAWVRVSAIRAGLKLRRSQERRLAREGVAAAREQLVKRPEDPELQAFRATHGQALGLSLAEACRALPARERSALRLNLVEGLSIDDIAALYGVHRATAARWVNRAKDRLRDDTRERLAQRLGLSPSEVSSVERALRSGLEITLSRILASEAESSEA